MKRKKLTRLIIICLMLLAVLFFSRKLIVRMFHNTPFNVAASYEDGWYGTSVPQFLFRGFFNEDEFEDVFVITSLKYREDSSIMHFFLLPGGASVPKELIPIKAEVQDTSIQFNNLLLTSAGIGDLNGDGFADVVIDYGFKVVLWMGQKGGGAFKLKSILKNDLVVDGAKSMKICDIDNNGMNELVLLNIHNDILSITFDSVFNEKVEKLAVLTSFSQEIEDSFVDMENSNTEDSFLYVHTEIERFYELKVADIDADNDLDIVIGNLLISHTDYIVLKNDGNGEFFQDKPGFNYSLPGKADQFSNNSFVLAKFSGILPDIVGGNCLYNRSEEFDILGILSNIASMDTTKDEVDDISTIFDSSADSASDDKTDLMRVLRDMHKFVSENNFDITPHLYFRKNVRELNLNKGIVAGHFGSQNLNDVLWYNKNGFYVYSSQENTFEYKNKNKLDFDDDICVAVACDLNNDGVDEPVIAVKGWGLNVERSGVYIYVYKEPIFTIHE